ncbi:E3 ubiquitin-protein ligase SH3RF2 isoform X2 [Pelobates fuscus]|uniref:E3 ubiquitin-protein ligase SH3RF2 isoform X2 n=1 Tax=Pelobates fuscus TaxID=191477 RepID=UPI002FE46AF9
MDELLLFDLLLDCPMCQRKLDVTAKVLPCQHTFCQPCLQRLLKAKKELRCPECLTPVFCNINELPANMFLVQLLHGVRGRQSLVRKNSLQRVGGLFANESFKRNREQKAKFDLQYRISSKARMPREEMPCAKALSNYRGRAPTDLTFDKGDIIVLHRQLDDNWYHGEINGDSGFFPASSVKVLRNIEQPPALCKALYNFELKDKEKGENKNCLTFLKGDIINVIRRVDDNWAEGKLGDKVGIFPLLFVEFNDTAKKLLESNKSKQNNLNNTPSQSKKSHSKTKNSESSTIRRIPEGRRKSLRPFSITNALNTFNKMVHSPIHHQIPEISTPVLISSSNPDVILKSVAISNSPVKVNAVYYTTGTGSPSVAIPNSQQSILANMYVVLHPYTANSPEQINLKKGEGVRVLGKFQEGWLRGVSLMTGKIGIFPSHCVNPIYRRSSNSQDPRTQSYPTAWISSNASVSSQSSVSDFVPTKPLRSFSAPSTMADPLKKIPNASSAMVPISQRKRNSIKSGASLQKSTQGNPLAVAITSNNRSPSSTAQPQVFSSASFSGAAIGAETWSRQNPCDTLSFPKKTVDRRRYSAASSVFFEGKDFSNKSETASKSFTSAPPSILVKPDTPKGGSEKVKTVRFMNFSPPTLRRQSFQFPERKNDQTTNVSTKQEAALTQESLLPTTQRTSSSSAQPEVKRVPISRNMINDPTLSTQSAVSSLSRRASADYTKRWSAIYHTQDVLSS